MKTKEKGKLYFSALGAATGIANGLFGSGGGIIAVPMLQKSGMKAKEAHAASLALTLPLFLNRPLLQIFLLLMIISDARFRVTGRFFRCSTGDHIPINM